MGIRNTSPTTTWVTLFAAFALCCLVCRAETTAQDQRAFADGLFHRGFHSEAIEEYERYLEQAPDAPDASRTWLRLGRAAVMIAAYNKALQAFEQAETTAAEETERLEARISRGESLFFLERYDEAMSVLSAADALEAPPEPRARALYYLGRARYEAGDIQAAVAAYEKLVTELPEATTAPFAQYHLGFALIDIKEPEKAAAAFSAAANADGAAFALRTESLFRAAELYDRLGWTAAALGAYEQLRAEFPDSEYARRAEYGYAWALYHGGRYDEALALAATLLEERSDTPHKPGLVYLRGNCYYQQRRYDDALRVYNALRAEHPDSVFAARALYKTAWARHLTGVTNAAREATLAFLDMYPDSELCGDARYLLGIICVADGDYEEALEQFLLVAEQYPDSEFSADALFKAAECYGQLGLRNESARAFEAFARRYPGNPLTEQAMLRSGDARFTAADFEEALDNYAGILESAPEDERILEETLYRMAVTYHNMKAHDDSAATFKKLLDAFPDSVRAAEAHFRIGEYELRQRENPLEAIASYQAALDSAEDGEYVVRALQGLAAARYEQKDYEQAAAQMLRLLHDYPDDALTEEAYLWCGQWLREVERWADAAAMYEAMLRHYPEHEERSGLWFLLGECREKAEAPDKALDAYARAREYTSDGLRVAEIQYRMGILHEARDEKDKALALLDAAANSDGGETSAKARFRLATLQERMGDHEAAARNYMRLAILYVHETLSPEALWRAGNCYLALDSPARARGVFQELIEDYPDSSFAEQARERLDTLAAHADQVE